MKHVYKAKRFMALFMTALMVLSLVNIAPIPAQAAAKKTISLNYSEYTLKKGKKLKLKAKVTPKKSKVVWTSSKKKVATVSSKGVVKALKNGTTKITAKIKGTSKKAVCKVSVGAPVTKITVAQPSVTLKVGESSSIKYSFTPAKPANKGVTFASSNAAVAVVSNKGVISAKAVGSATITVKAKDGSKKTAKVSVQVVSAEQTTQASGGQTTQAPGGQTTQQPGADQTTAPAPGGQTTEAPAVVHVESVTLYPEETVLEPDGKITLDAKVLPENATDTTVKFESENPEIAVVDPVTGEVTGVKEGETKVIVTTTDGGKTAECRVVVGIPVKNITLSDSEMKLMVGKDFTLTAEVEPANATEKKIVWTSSDESIATVDENGKVTALKSGDVTIEAATPDRLVVAQCKVKVEAPALTGIALEPESTVVEPEKTITIAVKYSPQYAEKKKVTWTSSDDKIATVDENGVVTGVANGSVTITAKTEDGKFEASVEITVGTLAKVASLDELKTELAKDQPADMVILETEAKESMEIPEGTYAATELVIQAPNATITNNAKFKKISIKAISKNTWIERATGNRIDIVAEDAHIVIEGEDADIHIGSGAGKVKIENNGSIKNLAIDTVAEVELSGTTQDKVPVTIGANGASLTTSIPVDVDAAESFKLTLQEGAQDSTIAVANDDVTAAVYGRGKIEVTNKETSETSLQLAENVTEDKNAAKGTISGKVVDEEKAAIKGAAVYVIPYTASFDQSNLQSAIDAAEAQKRVYATDTKEDGTYSVEVPYGNYVLIVKADKKQNFFQTIVLESETFENEEIVMAVFTEAKGDLTGTLYDALTAKPVAKDITLYIRAGKDNDLGEALARTKTDENGKYEFKGLDVGSYTIQVVDERSVELPYVKVTFNAVVLANTTVKENMTISTRLDSDQVRFVLTWGEQADDVPSDLDSHLIGPAAIGSYKFHTWYSDRSYYQFGKRYADLDVDDTTYEGPETSTVYTAVDGVYHFYVYDYSNQHDSDNTMLATSRAKVNVYVGNRCLATYYVPNAIGTLWDVCTYDIKNNQLSPINKITFHEGNSATVGISALDQAKAKLADRVNRYSYIDLGETVNAQIKAKLEEMNKILTESEKAEDIEKAVAGLDETVNEILDGTAIASVAAENLKDYRIVRMGSDAETTYDSYYQHGQEWYEEERDREEGEYAEAVPVTPTTPSSASSSTEREDGTHFSTIQKEPNRFSVIVVRGSSEKAVETLALTLKSDDAVSEVKASDLEEYQKLIEVKNNKTSAVEKYYLTYEKYVPSLTPWTVDDGENYIISMDAKETQLEDGTVNAVISVVGEEDALTKPEFKFYDSEVQAVYTPAADQEGYVGTLTASFGDQSKVWRVAYRKDVRVVMLTGITDEKNSPIQMTPYKDNYSSEEERADYRVSGALDELSADATFEFDAKVDADKVTCTKVADKAWNYEIKLVYKEKEQTIKLKYNKLGQESLLPERGEYYVNGSRYYFSSINWMKDESVQLTVAYNPVDIDLENSLLVRYDNSIVYTLAKKDAGYVMTGKVGEQTVLNCPVTFRYVPKVRNVTLQDNYLNTWNQQTNYTYDEDDALTATVPYLYISAENETLTQPEVTFEDANIEYTYAPAEEGEFAGTLKLTYPGGTMDYPVKYEQKLHTIQITGVKEEGTYVRLMTSKKGVYQIKGTADALSDKTEFTFDVEGLKPAKVTMLDGEAYNVEITVSYKGKEQLIRAKYEKLSDQDYTPEYGDYRVTSEGDTWSHDVGEMWVQDSVLYVSVTDEPAMIVKTSLRLNSYNGFTYRVAEAEQTEEGKAADYNVVVETEIEDAAAESGTRKLVLATYALQFVYEPKPAGVKDGENYIITCELTKEITEDGREVYVNVTGENDTLAEPVFIFDDPEITAAYDKEKAVLNVTKGTQKTAYPVRYTKEIHKLKLTKVESKTESYIKPRFDSDEVYLGNDKYAPMYRVYGLAETMGETALTLDVADDLVKDLTVKPVEAEDVSYTHEVSFAYKGDAQKFYLSYRQMSGEDFKPDGGRYYVKDIGSSQYISEIYFEQGRMKFYINDAPSSVDEDYSKCTFSRYRDDFTYQLKKEEDGLKLYVYPYQEKTEDGQAEEAAPVKAIISYPAEFVYLPYIDTVADEGNAYVSAEWSYGEGGYYMTIYGENDALTKPAFKFSNENTKGEYQAAETAGEYVGTVIVTNGSDKAVYPVKYVRQLHKVTLKSITKEGTFFEYDGGSDVRGMSVIMPTDVTCTFDVELKPEDYTVRRVVGDDWWYSYTNVITLKYKGETQEIYLEYKQIPDQDLAPSYATYTVKAAEGEEQEAESHSMNRIRLADDKLTAEVVYDSPADVDMESIRFTRKGYSYKVAKKDEVWTVTVSKVLGTAEEEATGEDGEAQEPKEPETMELKSWPLALSYHPTVTNAKDGEDEVSCYVNDYDGETEYCSITGENAELTDPKLTISDKKASFKYDKGSEVTVKDYNGEEKKCNATLTITNGEYSYTYPVLYTQDVQPLRLIELKEAGNNIQMQGTDYDENNIQYYIVEGLTAALGTGVVPKFRNSNYAERAADEYAFKAVENQAWNYDLELTYKGLAQTIHLKYQQTDPANVMPSGGSYKKVAEETGEEPEESGEKEDNRYPVNFYSSAIKYQNGSLTLILSDKETEIDKATLAFDDGYYYVYKVKVGEDEKQSCTLEVYYQESTYDEESGEYVKADLSTLKPFLTCPIVFRYMPQISSIMETDDEYVSDYGLRTAEDGTAYLWVKGYEKKMDNDVITMLDESLKAVFVPAAEGETTYAGTLKVTEAVNEENVVVSYPVMYETAEYRLRLYELTEEGNELGYLDGEYDIYDEETGEILSRYTITGTNEKLDLDKAKVTTNLYSEKALALTEVKVSEVTGNKYWNYDITVTYKATTKVFHLQYTQEKKESSEPEGGDEEPAENPEGSDEDPA